MASELEALSPVTVCGKRMPAPQLFSNIPMLHRILEEIVKDWLRALGPYQKKVDEVDGEMEQALAAVRGREDLDPVFLKCLFSYVLLFAATDKAYEHFYAELNRANNVSGLRLRYGKPPPKSAFVEKIIRIRNTAIAHFPSDRADPIDAFAAMTWQPMSLSWSKGVRPDLEKLTFSPGRFRGTDESGQRVESQDLEIPGVKTAHYDHCLPYLNRYDEVCCAYLQALQDKLPQS